MSYELIPKKLYEKINEIMVDKNGVESAIKFYNMYVNKLNLGLRLLEDGKIKDEAQLKNLRNHFVEMHSDELRGIDANYSSLFIQPLLDNGVIESNPYCNPAYGGYRGGENPKIASAYKYKFNRKYLDFNEISAVQISKSINLGKSKNLKREISYLKLLDFDFDKMIKKVENLNPEDCISMEPDLIFQKEKIIVEGVGARYLDEEEIDVYRMDGFELFEFKNKLHLASKDYFIQRKNLEMKLSYCNSIVRLMNGQFFAKTSEKNGRLTTSLTNLSKIFLEDNCITLFGQELIEFDLRNSQPCLLAFILEDLSRINELLPNYEYHLPKVILGEDSELFMQQVWNGTFYDEIAKQLNIPRDKAKVELFGVFFANNRDTKNEFKKYLKVLYPTVFQWISEFKRLNKSEYFSIMLQQIESVIFLKKTLPKIRQRGILVYTKHDCFLCKKTDYMKTRKIIESSFNDLGLKYQLAS
jgi:hypothetical protein